MIVLSVLVIVASLEVILWVSGMEPKPQSSDNHHIWCTDEQNLTEFHPEYGWTRPAGAQFLVLRDPDIGWKLNTFNEEGFRDTYNSGSQHIIVFGDSTTEGYLSDDNATYSFLLDKWSDNTSFHTFAVSGYGTDNHLAIYNNISDEYDHDLVIIGYYLGNDMRNNYNSKTGRYFGPHFGISNNTIVQTQVPSVENQTSQTNKQTDQTNDGIIGGKIQPFQDFLINNTRAYSFLAPKIANLVTIITTREAKQTNPNQPPTGGELDDQITLTEALLEEIAHKAESQNASVLIFSIPARGDVNPSKPVYYPYDAGQPYYDAQRQMLYNISASHPNISYISMKSHLQRERELGTQLYGNEDNHLTEDGHRQIALALHTRLAHEGLIKQSPESSLQQDYSRNLNTCPT